MWLQTLLFWIFSKSVSNLKVWTSTVQKNKMQALSAQHCQTHFSVTMVESSLELAVCGAKGGFSVKSIRLWQHKREDGSARQCVCVCKNDVENVKCFQHCLLSLQLCALCILFGRFCDLAVCAYPSRHSCWLDRPGWLTRRLRVSMVFIWHCRSFTST